MLHFTRLTAKENHLVRVGVQASRSDARIAKYLEDAITLAASTCGINRLQSTPSFVLFIDHNKPIKLPYIIALVVSAGLFLLLHGRICQVVNVIIATR